MDKLKSTHLFRVGHPRILDRQFKEPLWEMQEFFDMLLVMQKSTLESAQHWDGIALYRTPFQTHEYLFTYLQKYGCSFNFKSKKKER